jgi:hypothetical protein
MGVKIPVVIGFFYALQVFPGAEWAIYSGFK